MPYMLIIGDDEINSDIFSVRAHGRENIEKKKVDHFIKFILKKSKEKIKDFK